MSFNLAIAGFEVFIPEGRVAVKDIIDDVAEDNIPGAGTKAVFSKFLNETMGLQQVSKSEGPCTEMMEAVLEQFMQKKLVDPADVELVVVLQETATNLPINFGQHILHKGGFTNATSVNMGGNHCANIESVLPMLMRGPQKNILVLCGWRETGLSDRIYGAFGIVGDSAGLIWLSSTRRTAELVSFEQKTNIALHQGQTGSSPVIENFKLYTQLLDGLKTKYPEHFAGIKKIVIQNANPLLPTQMVGMKGLDKNTIFTDNLGRYGHLGPVDSVINLRDVLASGELSSGDKILSLTSGLYGSLAANIFQLN